MQVRYGMQTVNAITYSVGDINVSGWHLLALLAGLLDLLHVPDAQSRASELRPHLLPSLILQGSLSIRLTLDTAHQWTGEVHLVRVREGELHDRPDLGMQWRWLRLWGSRVPWRGGHTVLLRRLFRKRRRLLLLHHSRRVLWVSVGDRLS